MENINEQKDKMLWKQAKDRVNFKRHLLTYIGVNAFFWMIWFIDGDKNYHEQFPWPVYPMLGWGIGLFFNYWGAYHGHSKINAIEKEYEKLKRSKVD